MEEIMMDVARRFVALDEREDILLRSGYLERSDRDFRGRADSYKNSDGDVLWHRSSWEKSRFVSRVEFTPIPEWTFLIEELSVGAGSMIRYDLVNGRWQAYPNLPQFWSVRHRTAGVEVQGGICRNSREPRLIIIGAGCDAIYPWEDEDLKIEQVAWATRTLRKQPVVPTMPKVELFDHRLVTADARAAYLQAARVWSDEYISACEVWARNFEQFPECLPFDGDAYVYGDLRIPAELFDFDFLMQALTRKLDGLLKHLPPDNKYLVATAR